MNCSGGGLILCLPIWYLELGWQGILRVVVYSLQLADIMFLYVSDAFVSWGLQFPLTALCYVKNQSSSLLLCDTVLVTCFSTPEF